MAKICKFPVSVEKMAEGAGMKSKTTIAIRIYLPFLEQQEHARSSKRP